MTYKLLAGGYTDGGLYSLSFDAANKKLKLGESRIPAGSNPSWIATHPSDNTVVFATNEVDDGRVLAIKLAGMDASDGVTGEPVKNVSSGGACPAHLLVTKDAIVPGNYMGGSILNVPYSVSPLSLADTSKERKEGDFVQFNGTGPNADRQEASHPHEVYAYENELLIPDLGADKTWRLTKGAAGWDLKDSIDYPAGSGPRHVLIHGGYLYTVLELSNQLAVHKYAALPSAPTSVATLSTFASGSPADPTMLAAEILLTPSKKHIYVSNRNDPSAEGDTIAVFSVATDSDECKLVREIRTGVKHARGMNFSKDGKYLAVAGSTTGSVKIFEILEGSVDGEVALVASVEGIEKPTAVIWL